MTFIFKEFVTKIFSNFIDSLTPCCVGPSPGKLDFDEEEDEELKHIAKTMTIKLGESPSTNNLLLDDNMHEYTLHERKEHQPHRHQLTQSRDYLLISGYLHQLEQTSTAYMTSNNCKFGVKPILDVCLSYYCVRRRNSTNLLYLLAEQCDEQQLFPSLDHSDDEYEDEHVHRHRHHTEQRYTAAFVDNSACTHGGIYISQISDTRHKHYCQIYELEDLPQDEEDEDLHRNRLSIFSDEWIVKFAGLASAKDIILPPSIHKHVIQQYQHARLQGEIQRYDSKLPVMREYNVLFKLCGSGRTGWSNSCSAVIVDETSLSRRRQTETDLMGFHWHLPSLPCKTGGNGVCFDSEHGLFSCGGYKSSSVYALAFNGDDYMQQNYNWNWRDMPEMNEVRWFPSCVFANNRLIAMCGSSADHEPLSSMEYFDFDTQEWLYLSSCNKARKYGGLSAMTKSTKKLYLGGGDHATQCVEVYDFEANQWYNLPATQLPHRYYPNLWTDENENILYISCSYSNSIESLDLRSNESSWNVMCGADVFPTHSLGLDYNQFRSVL